MAEKKLPPEARAALMRAWIAILEKRHPGVVWIPVEEREERPDDQGVDETTDSSTDEP
jgi:hypothetical protein